MRTFPLFRITPSASTTDTEMNVVRVAEPQNNVCIAKLPVKLLCPVRECSHEWRMRLARKGKEGLNVPTLAVSYNILLDVIKHDVLKHRSFVATQRGLPWSARSQIVNTSVILSFICSYLVLFKKNIYRV